MELVTKLFIGTLVVCGLQFKTSEHTIEIISVNADISTVARVECSQFENSFDGEKKTRRIANSKAVDNFLNELKNLEKFDGRTATDTRAQILIKYSDHIDKICADRFSICYNGQCYKITDNLKRKIWR